MSVTNRLMLRWLWAVVVCVAMFGHPNAQQTTTPGNMTPEQLRAAAAASPELFLKTMRSTRKWDEPADPLKVGGPIYFVGTKGLGVWLLKGSQGDILVNTGMPGSGPMIEVSIQKLGLNPKDIKWLLVGHAHVDHVGGHAYIQKLTGAKVAIAAEQVGLLQSGGKGDFNYDGVSGFEFDPVKVDRILRDGDVVKLGDIALTAHLTAGHTIGSMTWTTDFVDHGNIYSVVLPDGTSVNPGYRLVKNPSYPGIEGDYRNTLHFLETLKPDIWLHAHTDAMAFEAKRARAATEGVLAWVDPEGYRTWVASERAKFEALVDSEMGIPAKAK